MASACGGRCSNAVIDRVPGHAHVSLPRFNLRRPSGWHPHTHTPALIGKAHVSRGCRYSWMQRTAQITEFNLLKETVKRLERSSREQLLLENESQGAFDHVTAEVGRLKDAVSALSKVVDDELDALRGECLSLRQELQSVFGRSRKETHTAVAAVGEKRKQDVALSAQGLQEVRTALAKLEEEVRQNRGLCQDLTKEVTRLDGGIDGARNTLTKQCEGLASRLGVAEAQSVANKEELSESQRRDRAEVAAAAAAAVAAQQQQQEQQQQQQQPRMYQQPRASPPMLPPPPPMQLQPSLVPQQLPVYPLQGFPLPASFQLPQYQPYAQPTQAPYALPTQAPYTLPTQPSYALPTQPLYAPLMSPVQSMQSVQPLPFSAPPPLAQQPLSMPLQTANGTSPYLSGGSLMMPRGGVPPASMAAPTAPPSSTAAALAACAPASATTASTPAAASPTATPATPAAPAAPEAAASAAKPVGDASAALSAGCASAEAVGSVGSAALFSDYQRCLTALEGVINGGLQRKKAALVDAARAIEENMNQVRLAGWQTATGPTSLNPAP